MSRLEELSRAERGQLTASHESMLAMDKQIAIKFPMMDFSIALEDEAEIIVGVKKVLKNFFPSWDTENFTMRQFTDGITNKLFKVATENVAEKQSALVRVYGHNTEVLIDREQEIMTIVCLSQEGLGSELFGRFNNGICYGFIRGKAFTPEDMQCPIKSKLVARKLAALHNTTVWIRTRDRSANLFRTLGKWVNELRLIEAAKAADDPARVPNMEQYEQELVFLETSLTALNSKVVFCHNDLLCGNILYDHDENGVCSVNFIDFEYGNYNYRSFDIGNHFCEMIGYDVDLSLFPTIEFETIWLREYLHELHTLRNKKEKLNLSDDDIQALVDAELPTLLDEVNKFAVSSHYFWSVWSLIQAANSDNSTFDYRAYSGKRLNAYFLSKQTFFQA